MAEEVVEMDFSTPGNSFQFRDKRVAVEGYTMDETGMELDVVVEDAPAPPAVTSSSIDPRKPFGGFTYEEELFRLKWGWWAFDQSRRLAAGMGWRRALNSGQAVHDRSPPALAAPHRASAVRGSGLTDLFIGGGPE